MFPATESKKSSNFIMANNVAPTFAKSEVKSGLENEAYMKRILDGEPPRKDVDAIQKENCVKRAPDTAGV